MTIWMMLCTNVKRESYWDNGSNANTKICFEVRAPSSTSPPSPRRIFTTREYRTPLSNTASQPRGRPVAKQPQHLYRRGLQPISNSTSPRGSKQQSPPLPKREQTPTQYNNLNLYQRGSNPIMKGFTTSDHKRSQTQSLFPQTNDPNRIG